MLQNKSLAQGNQKLLEPATSPRGNLNNQVKVRQLDSLRNRIQQIIKSASAFGLPSKRVSKDEDKLKIYAKSPSKKSPQTKKQIPLQSRMADYKRRIQQNQKRLSEFQKIRGLGSPKKAPIKKQKANYQGKQESMASKIENSIYQDYAELFRKDIDSDSPLLKSVKEKQFSKEKHSPCEQAGSCISLTINKKEEIFLIIRFLDKGSYGKVYLVRHLKTGIILSIKTIEKCRVQQNLFGRLIQQIKIQSAMNHPSILNLYGYAADAEFIYLLLEPCLGSNMYQKLSKEVMKEKQVKKYVKQICSAVEHMHSKNVIHRDIKAENILVHENTVKVCDFGWAVYAPTLRNTQCGTPVYTPPQIVKNEYYDKKVDVWCVGVLTYEMLFATSPFQIRHPFDMAKIIEEQVFFSKDILISSEAENFICKCLEKVPANRFGIHQAMRHAFLVKKIEDYRHTLA